MRITANTTGLSAAYTAAVNYVVQTFNSLFTNNISLTINFQAMTSGFAMSQFYGYYFSYSAVKGALASHATSADDRAAVSALPSASPFGTSSYFVSVAEAAALGLSGTTNAGNAGSVFLNTNLPLTYDPNNRSVSGKYDAIGAIVHEVAEILGRTAGSDGALLVSPLALQRYSAPGVIDTSNSAANAYFSVDGKTMLNKMGETGGDIADWGPSISGDSFGYASSGLAGQLSATDLRVMDVLGYTLSSSTPASSKLTKSSNNLHYSNTVVSAYHQYAYIDGLNYIASFTDLIDAFGSDANAGSAHFVNFGAKEGRVSTFDGLDYIASYSDLIDAFHAGSEKSVQDAGASHFIANGLSEGRATTFNGLDYVASYVDLIRAFGADNDMGAYHYIENGEKENRKVSFDGLSYIAKYADLMTAFGADEQGGAAHFIQFGSKEGRTAAFDVAGYQAAHTDLIGKYATNDDFLTAYITTYKATGTFLT